ncbi:E3 ubiquitin-protein ligase znrf2 [Nibea albiflora]|uniref:E3 ubiquitin-protein ligase znrf2 n=1 Tax=Nibea albiflora TaxID=240163 RepID=A0ACB7F7Z3_NIBAL|nr:E3 ubiquitin-protein ligase znrf2 [Nibea albiflora]
MGIVVFTTTTTENPSDVTQVESVKLFLMLHFITFANFLCHSNISHTSCVYLEAPVTRGFKCPVCSKFVSSDEMDLHLVLCLTKPRVTYNEDVLTKDAGECAICLEELVQGDTIARLPCLCIYHKGLRLDGLISPQSHTGGLHNGAGLFFPSGRWTADVS